MKYKIILTIGLCLIGLSHLMHAQSISAYMIGSTGGTLEQFTYSVGDLVISTARKNGVMLSQGFQQPIEISLTTSIKDFQEKLSVRAFPNPSSGLLNLSITSELSSTVECEILDLQGRSVLGKREIAEVQGETIQWELHTLAAGQYFLRISTSDHLPLTIPFQLTP
ncbi:MAG: T9SS type A sorting domain-containing protein [Bacteroidota bacterium]